MTTEEPPSATAPRAPEAGREAAQWFAQGLPGSSAHWLVTLGLLATLVGGGIAPALPGSRAGIDGWIAVSDHAGALLTQMLVVLGLGLATWLVLITLRNGELATWYRIACVPLVALVATLSAGAIAEPLHPLWSSWMAISAGLVALAAAPQAWHRPLARGPACVLGLMALSAVVDLGARWVALRASDQALSGLFSLARYVATLSFALKLSGLGLALAWLGARRWRVAVPSVLAVVSGLVALGVAASHASQVDVSWWQVLASRVLDGYSRHPIPLILPLLSPLMDLALLAAAASSLLVRRASGPVRAVMALALLGRGMTDIPVSALMLTVAALMAPLLARAQAPEARSASSS
jgi:hypothetical protein